MERRFKKKGKRTSAKDHPKSNLGRKKNGQRSGGLGRKDTISRRATEQGFQNTGKRKNQNEKNVAPTSLNGKQD